MRGECAKREGDLLLKEFLGNHIIEMVMKMIEIEGSIAVLLPEHFGNIGVLEFSIEEGPVVAKSGHVSNTFLSFFLGDVEEVVWFKESGIGVLVRLVVVFCFFCVGVGGLGLVTWSRVFSGVWGVDAVSWLLLLLDSSTGMMWVVGVWG